MIKFFRKIRKKLLSENKFNKYILYAIGEVLLVMIGILLALQINNWNERKKIRNVEKTILEGIRENIVLDTIDINLNIRTYKKYINQSSSVLYNLNNQKKKNDSLINQLYYISTDDRVITLHRAYFDQAKQKGLSIISNKALRTKISRLYEFEYPYITTCENEYQGYDYFKILYPTIFNFFELDPSGISHNKVTITEEKYNLLLSNKSMHLKIFEAKTMAELLLAQYKRLQPKTLETLYSIEKELESFEL